MSGAAESGGSDAHTVTHALRKDDITKRTLSSKNGTIERHDVFWEFQVHGPPPLLRRIYVSAQGDALIDLSCQSTRILNRILTRHMIVAIWFFIANLRLRPAHSLWNHLAGSFTRTIHLGRTARRVSPRGDQWNERWRSKQGRWHQHGAADGHHRDPARQLRPALYST